MSEASLGTGSAAESPSGSAGALLRQARQAKGLHIAALANAIKVTPQKLEALEADRYDELPGATFTRALAQTVCRTLKIDAAPVLALLPQSPDKGLEKMSRGLNEPFRDRPGQRPPRDFSMLKNPAVLGSLMLVVAAVVVYLLPADWWGLPADSVPPTAPAEAVVTPPAAVGLAVGSEASAPVPAAASDAAASSVGAPVPPMTETVHSAPPEPAVAASDPASAPIVKGALQLRTTAESWVEITDARGVALLSRLLPAGETVGVDGTAPLRLKIGNAAATVVTYRGQPIDITTAARDNVARIEVK